LQSLIESVEAPAAPTIDLTTTESNTPNKQRKDKSHG